MSLVGLAGRWYDRQQAAESSRGEAGNRAWDDKDTQPFEKLTGFIPIDVITLFVAAVGFLSAAAGSDEDSNFVRLIASISMWHAYFFFAFIVTPSIAFLVHWVKQEEARKESKEPVKSFAWWPMVSAIIAFLAWAPALPGMVTSDIGKVGVSFLALFISTILSTIDRAFR